MGEEGAKPGMKVHGNEYHDPDYEQEGVAAGLVSTHEAKATGIHNVGASTVESAAGAQAKVDAHKDLATGIHNAGSNYLALAPATSHLVRTFTKGWTSKKFLQGAGVDSDPTEVLLTALDEKWIREYFLVDPEDDASFWDVEKTAWSQFVTKAIGRLDFSTGPVNNSYIRLYANLVAGGTYGGAVFIAHTQWAGTVRTNSTALIGVWELNTARRPSLTDPHFGWKILNGEIWATIANGSSETAVDTGVSYDDPWKSRLLKILVTAASNYEFYVDGTLKCTLSTNKPSFSTSEVYMDISTEENADKRIMIQQFVWRLVYP